MGMTPDSDSQYHAQSQYADLFNCNTDTPDGRVLANGTQHETELNAQLATIRRYEAALDVIDRLGDSALEEERSGSSHVNMGIVQTMYEEARAALDARKGE